jgi:hypothetical protein
MTIPGGPRMTYSLAWDKVSRGDVVRALDEYDRLGPERFFAEHGFASTTTYELIRDERPYPPKAILGTAYEFATGQRLASGDFEGGKAGAVKVLAISDSPSRRYSGQPGRAGANCAYEWNPDPVPYAGDVGRLISEAAARAMADGREIEPDDLRAALSGQTFPNAPAGSAGQVKFSTPAREVMALARKTASAEARDVQLGDIRTGLERLGL